MPAPADSDFLTGTRGHPWPRPLHRMRDRLLDARLALARAGERMDALADAAPRRAVLVVSVYRPGGGLLPAALERMRETRHDLRVALGSMGEPAPPLADATVAAGLSGGKFANVNGLLATAEEAGGQPDWAIVLDDDVVLPERFLDRFVGVCEQLDLALAQPAHSRAGFASWPVTRRRGGSMARETNFVEIGPVTAFRRDALAALTPFPELRFGWGLDLHWSAVAAERGWRLGIVDALPIRHEQSAVAVSYSSDDAIAEARRFLSERPFVPSARALETVRSHPLP